MEGRDRLQNCFLETFLYTFESYFLSEKLVGFTSICFLKEAGIKVPLSVYNL